MSQQPCLKSHLVRSRSSITLLHCPPSTHAHLLNQLDLRNPTSGPFLFFSSIRPKTAPVQSAATPPQQPEVQPVLQQQDTPSDGHGCTCTEPDWRPQCVCNPATSPRDSLNLITPSCSHPQDLLLWPAHSSYRAPSRWLKTDQRRGLGRRMGPAGRHDAQYLGYEGNQRCQSTRTRGPPFLYQCHRRCGCFL